MAYEDFKEFKEAKRKRSNDVPELKVLSEQEMEEDFQNRDGRPYAEAIQQSTVCFPVKTAYCVPHPLVLSADKHHSHNPSLTLRPNVR